MKYKIIKGTFRVTGYVPGGDCIRFSAANDENWDYFDWGKRRQPKRKQLRLEAINTPEIYYRGFHQPYPVGFAALEAMLELIGIRDAVFNLSLSRIHSAKDDTEGFIACQALDLFACPVSLIFANDAPLQDGDEISLADLPLEQCINVKLARMGLAYPTFYNTTEGDLIDLFSTIAAASRKAKLGLWELDKTSDFVLKDVSTVTDDIMIFPKLFRRLVAFFHARSSFAHLASFLAHEEDRVLVKSTGQTVYWTDLLVVEDGNIRFPYTPEDMIFEPRDR